MFTYTNTLLKIGMLLLVVACAPINTGDVDPEWLKSWNEAVERQPDTLTSVSKVTSEDEPGEPLFIRGQIFKPNGKEVAPNVLIHIYHRDHAGYDFGPNDNSLTTWRLQGWAKTDAKGCFEFHTIKPAPDHLGREGAHIHFTTVSEEYGTQWAPKIHFSDDSTLSDKEKKTSAQAEPFGWVKKVKRVNDIQTIDITIKLKTKTDF